MSNRIDKKDLVKRVQAHVSPNDSVETIVDVVFEEIYVALKHRETVSLRNFGTFYIDDRQGGTAFKFNPSQRLRAMLGWSSSYKGDV